MAEFLDRIRYFIQDLGMGQLRGLVLVGGVAAIVSLFFVIIGTGYHYYRHQSLPFVPSSQVQAQDLVQMSATPKFAESSGVMIAVDPGDARPLLIAQFLEEHDSPLKPYDYFGRFLTQLADEHELDFRLLPSIAMQESNVCKKIPPGSFNCLGLGVHSRGTWHFDRYEDNFRAAAEILKKNYIDIGLVTPELIQRKYTPSSNGSWQFAVNHFMDEIETADF